MRDDDTLGEAVVLRMEGTVPEDVDAEEILNEWREKLKAVLGSAKTPRVLEWGPTPPDRARQAQRPLLT